MSRSIRTTWLVILLALSLLPLLIVGALVSWNTYAREQRHAQEFQSTVTTQAVNQLSSFIEVATNEARLIVQTPDFVGATRERQEAVLAQAIFYRNIFDGLTLIDNNGQELARASRLGVAPPDQLRDRSADAVFQLTMERSKQHYGNIYFSSISGEPLLPVAVPVLDAVAGTPVGVLEAQVRMRQIFDTVANLQFGEKGLVAILNSDGMVVAHRDPQMIGQIAANALQASGDVRTNDDGSTSLVTSAPLNLGYQSLYVIGEIPAAEALAPAYDQLRAIATILFGSAMIATLIGALAVRQLTNPISALARAVKQISAGNLGQHVQVTAQDEIGTLQHEFNQMACSLAEQRESIAARNADLQNALAELRDRAAAQEILLGENARQREEIRELSIPILPVGADTLVMPLVGALDTERLLQLQERALYAVERTHARRLLIDVTGVAVIDTQIAQGIVNSMYATRLLGAEAALVGIRPEVAQSIVGLGIDLATMRTFKDLQTAL